MADTDLKRCLLAFIIASLWSSILLTSSIIGSLVGTDALRSVEDGSTL